MLFYNEIVFKQKKRWKLMKERLKLLRKELDLTQQAFADKLNITRANIAGYETGSRNPSDAVISLICKQFNVNEQWLRTGVGEMFPPQDRLDEIASISADLFDSEPESFKYRLITAIAKMNENDLEALERLVLGLAKK